MNQSIDTLSQLSVSDERNFMLIHTFEDLRERSADEVISDDNLYRVPVNSEVPLG